MSNTPCFKAEALYTIFAFFMTIVPSPQNIFEFPWIVLGYVIFLFIAGGTYLITLCEMLWECWVTIMKDGTNVTIRTVNRLTQ